MVPNSQSDKTSNKVSLFVGIFSLILALLSLFITVSVLKSITLSISQICLLALGCGIASAIITKLVLFLDIRQKNKSAKIISQPEVIIDVQSSPEEFILAHVDFIEKKISEYSELDIQQVNNRYVNFFVCENAGNLICDEGDGTELTRKVLCGKDLASAMVIILDYETHDIIRTYHSDQSGNIRHYSMGNEKFYCVVALPGYNLYVSEPFFVNPEIENECLGAVGLYLSKPNFHYNEPICIRVKVRDLNQPTQSYKILSDHRVSFRCIKSLTKPSNHQVFDSMYYTVYTNSSGVISRGGSTTYYFELNTEYELDISPALPEISSGIIPYFYDLPYKTISGSPNNTNLIDVFVDYDGGKVEMRSYLLG